jgi:hypothetical protein
MTRAIFMILFATSIQISNANFLEPNRNSTETIARIARSGRYVYCAAPEAH